MPKKKRVKIDDELASEILYRSEHTCCLCKNEGKPVQIHHINEDPSDNRMENLAVVCVECQNKIHRKGGIEKSYLPDEVRKHKILWEAAVANRRKYLGTPPIVRKIKEFDQKTGMERVIEEKIPYTNGLALQAINMAPSVSLSREKELIMEEVKEIIRSQLGGERLLSILSDVKETKEIKVDDAVVLSRVCLSVGDSKFHVKDYNLAEIFYKEALDYAKTAKEEGIVTVCLYEIGSSVGMQGRDKEALGYFNKVIKRGANIRVAWFAKGVALSSLKKYKRAILAYHKTIELSEKKKDWYSVGDAYYNMGIALDGLKKRQGAIDSYRKAIEFGEKGRNWETVRDAYYNMGFTQSRCRKRKDAIVSYRKAIEFGKKIGSWDKVANAYYNMASSFDKLKRPQNAIDSYWKAIGFGEKSRSWETIANSYYNMAFIQNELRKNQDASYCYWKAIEFGGKAKNGETVASAYYNVGIIQSELGKDEDAVDCYKKAIEGRNFLPDRGKQVFESITRLVCILGTVNSRDKNYAEARRFAGIIAETYLDGEKEGMGGLIEKVMGEFESWICKEGYGDAFQQFKEYFESVKNKGNK